MNTAEGLLATTGSLCHRGQSLIHSGPLDPSLYTEGWDHTVSGPPSSDLQWEDSAWELGLPLALLSFLLPEHSLLGPSARTHLSWWTVRPSNNSA